MSHPEWKEEIGHAEPLPSAVSSADERILSAASSGSAFKRISLTLLAILVFGGPLLAHFAQDRAIQRAAEEKVLIQSTMEQHLIASRVAGQFTQGVALLERAADDIRRFDGSRSDAVALTEKTQTGSRAAIAFFTSANAQSLNLLSGNRAGMDAETHRAIFGDTDENVIEFYRGAATHLGRLFNAGETTIGDEDRMIAALSQMQQRDAELRAWLTAFQRNTHR